MSFLGFKNSRIYVYGKGIVETSLTIENGHISNIGNEVDALVELPKKYIVIPGFVDKHTHGANHADFMNPSIDDIKKILSSVVKEGTTS